jgi:hypothetical protein
MEDNKMKLDWIAQISVIALLILLSPATAHQPFFEEKDFRGGSETMKGLQDGRNSGVMQTGIKFPYPSI